MEALPGIVREFGIKDANNMGAAMAPATADTIARYFSLSGNKPSDFDMILTGDLGAEGFELLKIMMKQYGYEMGTGFNDCGLMIYDLKNQDVGAGGSGCGCSGVVFGGYVMEQFMSGAVKDVLLIGTGALLSPTTVMQNLPIPAVAHLVRLKKD